MSLRSMTGHGRGEASRSGLRATVEISSVNRKQLDIQFNLPPALRLLESRLQDEIIKCVSRGRVNIQLWVQGSDRLRRESVRVDTGLAASYRDAIRSAARALDIPDGVSLQDLIRLPGVLVAESKMDDVDVVWPVVQQAARRAITAMERMRKREGLALRADLHKRIGLLATCAARVEREAPGVTSRHRDALRERLSRSGLNLPEDDDRLQKELILFADRSDITEELTRLLSHLEQGLKMLDQAEPAGRSLDFLAQELFREINTIGSKANDARIAREVVTMKTELERLREQVQNIE